MSLRHLARLAVLAVGLVLVPLATAFAQSGVTRIIIGVPAGGAIDPYARMVADHMSKTLGHPIIVENKVGASGNVAAQYIADQPADGSIIWLGTQAFVEILPNVFKNSRWSIDNFHPIIRGSKRRWCSSSIRAWRPRPSQSFLPGRSRTRASSATPPIKRARRRTSSASR